jgi:hypothetical protein
MACELRLMRRLLVTGVVLLALSGSTAAGAATHSATLTGAAEWSDASTHVHGTFAGTFGKGSYDGTLDGGAQFTTGDCGPVCEPVSGSITFTSKRGSFTGVVEPGSVVALVDIASNSWRNFTLTLDVVDATRAYKPANGAELTLSYSSDWAHFFDFDTGQFVNTITDSGTLTGSLH